MSSRDDRIAFVAELHDPAEVGRLTGLFAVHWESEEDERWDQGPEDVSAEEAIAWARQHATRVLVRLGDDDTFYSAGEKDFPDATPRWPDAGILVRPRPLGAPRDGSQQQVDWLVRAELGLAGELPPDAPTRLRAIVSQDERASHVEVGSVGGQLVVQCRFTARSMEASTVDAHKLVEAALREALHDTAREPQFRGSTATLGPVKA